VRFIGFLLFLKKIERAKTQTQGTKNQKPCCVSVFPVPSNKRNKQRIAETMLSAFPFLLLFRFYKKKKNSRSIAAAVKRIEMSQRSRRLIGSCVRIIRGW
jgi:hypothetical protein